jgi:hypothetical protein
MPENPFRIVDIDILPGYIEITAQDQLVPGIEISGQVIVKALKPRQFVLELGGFHLKSLGDVRINHNDPGERRRYQAVFVTLAVLHSVDNLIGLHGSNDSNTSPFFAALENGMIAQSFEFRNREKRIFGFGFLHAEYSGLCRFQPGQDYMQP